MNTRISVDEQFRTLLVVHPPIYVENSNYIMIKIKMPIDPVITN